MSDQPIHPESDDALQMPGKPKLVAEAIARLDTIRVRSQLLQLDTQTLHDLGLRLTDRKATVRAAWSWLNQELGASEESPLVDDNAVYRFREHFVRLYQQVRREHAQRIARLSVSQATDGQVRSMHQVATARLVELVAEKLVATDDLEDLSGTELAGVIATVDGIAKGQVKREELALKAADAERRERKLVADITRMQAEIALKTERIKARVDDLSARLATIEAAKAAGKAINPELWDALRTALVDIGNDVESIKGATASASQ